MLLKIDLVSRYPQSMDSRMKTVYVWGSNKVLSLKLLKKVEEYSSQNVVSIATK